MAHSTTFMLSRAEGATTWRRNQNTVRHSFSSKQFGPIAHTVLVVLLLCIMGLLYLAQINKTNAYTYPINELETKKSTLLDEHAQLEIEAARLGSLENVKNSTVAKNMTNPSGVDTIR